MRMGLLPAFAASMVLLLPEMGSTQQVQRTAPAGSCSYYYQGCSAARANSGARSVGKATGICEQRYNECMSTGTYTTADGKQFPGLVRQ
jgi:hypothetical protein